MSEKIRKPPSMPHWYWRDLDGCWFCKDRSNCHNCSVMKKFRKENFSKKEKSRHSKNDKGYKRDYEIKE